MKVLEKIAAVIRWRPCSLVAMNRNLWLLVCIQFSLGCQSGSQSNTSDAGFTGVDMVTDSLADMVANSLADMGYDSFQQHNLTVLNNYRVAQNIAPLTLDAQLTAFAQAGSVELSQDHLPHQHIKSVLSTPTWENNYGFANSAGENQGDQNGWGMLSSDPTQNELMQIDAVLAAMYSEGPSGGHYQNIMSTEFSRVGVGLLEVGGLLYLTNDFSNSP